MAERVEIAVVCKRVKGDEIRRFVLRVETGEWESVVSASVIVALTSHRSLPPLPSHPSCMPHNDPRRC